MYGCIPADPDGFEISYPYHFGSFSPAHTDWIRARWAKDITVTPGSSIRAALDTADQGDTFVLNFGIHTTNRTIGTKDITLRADTAHGHGPSDTITYGGSTLPRIFTVSGSASMSIDNRTLQNGRAGDDGTAGSDGSYSSIDILDSGRNGGRGGPGRDLFDIFGHPDLDIHQGLPCR